MSDAERIHAERLAAALYIAIFAGHPMYPNTAGWRGGIGGQAITTGCSFIDPPPGQEWIAQVLQKPMRDFLAAYPNFDLLGAAEALSEGLSDWFNGQMDRNTSAEELENLERIAAGMTPSLPTVAEVTRAAIDSQWESLVLNDIDNEKAWRVSAGQWRSCCPQCYMLDGHKMDCTHRTFIFDRLPHTPVVPT